MRGLAEHLGLVVLQQRGAIVSLEAELYFLAQEVHAMKGLTAGYCHVEPVDGSVSSEAIQPLPPQTPLREAAIIQRRGLRRALEAVREVQLVLMAVDKTEIAVPASLPSTPVTDGGWEEGPTDSAASVAVKEEVSGLGRSISGMLGRLAAFPSTCCVAADIYAGNFQGKGERTSVSPLLPPGAVHALVYNQTALEACSEQARAIAVRFAHVVPPAALTRVSDHCDELVRVVQVTFDASPVMVAWLAGDSGTSGKSERMKTTDGVSQGQIGATAAHAAKFGHELSETVKALLLSVQALSRPKANTGGQGDGTPDTSNVAIGGDDDDGAEDVEPAEWSTATTLLDAHVSAFEQARSLKLTRCAAALASVRMVLKGFSDDEAIYGAGDSGVMLTEAGDVMVKLAAGVLELAQQVLSAGRAVLVGMVVLNKVSLSGYLVEHVMTTAVVLYGVATVFNIYRYVTDTL